MRLVGGILAVAFMALTPSALAAVPANDDFSDARTIRAGTLTIGTTAGATRERFEPVLGYGEGGGTVWYRLRAARTGFISVSVCGSASDHHLGAFRGSTIKSLDMRGTGLHDGCPIRSDFSYGGTGMNFSVVEGATYRIAVGAFEAPDQGRFQLVTAEMRNYRNDAFASPATLRRRVIQNNEWAEREAGEPRHARASAAHSLWYRWRAPATGTFQLSTEGSSFDTRLAVYRGGVIRGLRRVASNDDASRRTVSSRVRFRASRGSVYRIAVDGTESRVSSGVGDVVLTVSR